MEGALRSVYWEAPEHHHIEKTADWYWILGILAVASAVASILFGNTLFGIIIILASLVMMLYGYKGPRTIGFEISTRGIRIDSETYPYATLASFYLDTESPLGPQVIVKPRNLFGQLLILPIPFEYIEEIENILESKLPEEHLEEPLSHKLLEFFGF